MDQKQHLENQLERIDKIIDGGGTTESLIFERREIVQQMLELEKNDASYLLQKVKIK